jgi:hypothetical protein
MQHRAVSQESCVLAIYRVAILALGVLLLWLTFRIDLLIFAGVLLATCLSHATGKRRALWHASRRAQAGNLRNAPLSQQLVPPPDDADNSPPETPAAAPMPALPQRPSEAHAADIARLGSRAVVMRKSILLIPRCCRPVPSQDRRCNPRPSPAEGKSSPRPITPGLSSSAPPQHHR